jgi:hypothetical protein
MKVSVTEAARALAVSREHVPAIVNGRAGYTGQGDASCLLSDLPSIAAAAVLA